MISTAKGQLFFTSIFKGLKQNTVLFFGTRFIGEALTFLASGQIPQNSNSYSALKDKELEMNSFRNQSIIGLLLLVFLSFIVF